MISILCYGAQQPWESSFAQGKKDEAISHYKIAIKLKPDYAEGHNNLGNALFTVGKTEEAISHYKIVIKLKPDYAEVNNNLKKVLNQSEK